MRIAETFELLRVAAKQTARLVASPSTRGGSVQFARQPRWRRWWRRLRCASLLAQRDAVYRVCASRAQFVRSRGPRWTRTHTLVAIAIGSESIFAHNLAKIFGLCSRSASTWQVSPANAREISGLNWKDSTDQCTASFSRQISRDCQHPGERSKVTSSLCTRCEACLEKLD